MSPSGAPIDRTAACGRTRTSHRSALTAGYSARCLTKRAFQALERSPLALDNQVVNVIARLDRDVQRHDRQAEGPWPVDEQSDQVLLGRDHHVGAAVSHGFAIEAMSAGP